jgi:uncharacterized protein YbjQ (UPF0145 family)
MERCHGKTKAGERCKRSAREGSRYCASHADQEKQTRKAKERADAAGPDAVEEVEVRAEERDDIEALLLAAAVGVAVVVVVVVGRLFRL